MMFDKLTRSRIRALGADPDALGRMKDCSVLNAASCDYFGRASRHERNLHMDLTSGAWTIVCICGAHGEGSSFLDAIESWNSALVLYGNPGRRAPRRIPSTSIGHVVPFTPKRGA